VDSCAESVAPLARRFGEGRIGKISGITDPSPAFFVLNLSFESRARAVEFADGALQLLQVVLLTSKRLTIAWFVFMSPPVIKARQLLVRCNERAKAITHQNNHTRGLRVPFSLESTMAKRKPSAAAPATTSMASKKPRGKHVGHHHRARQQG
jgi:hypothetical protein